MENQEKMINIEEIETSNLELSAEQQLLEELDNLEIRRVELESSSTGDTNPELEAKIAEVDARINEIKAQLPETEEAA